MHFRLHSHSLIQPTQPCTPHAFPPLQDPNHSSTQSAIIHTNTIIAMHSIPSPISDCISFIPTKPHALPLNIFNLAVIPLHCTCIPFINNSHAFIIIPPLIHMLSHFKLHYHSPQKNTIIAVAYMHSHPLPFQPHAFIQSFNPHAFPPSFPPHNHQKSPKTVHINPLTL